MRTVKPNLSAVAAKVIDGEAIIMNLTNGAYYSMTGVGGHIWSCIESSMTEGAILESMLKRYAVDAESAREDLERLISSLQDDGLVLVTGEKEMTGHLERGGSEAYEAPVLNKYTEMADLLALDPPMPELTEIPRES